MCLCNFLLIRTPQQCVAELDQVVEIIGGQPNRISGAVRDGAFPTVMELAHYNSAYCLVSKKKNEKADIEQAKDHLSKAVKCLDPYIAEIMSIQQCVQLVNRIRQQTEPERRQKTETDNGTETAQQVLKPKFEHKPENGNGTGTENGKRNGDGATGFEA